MTQPTHDASARQHSGELSPVPGHPGNWTSRSGCTDLANADHQIAELRDRSTPELRLAWRQLHRTGPPPGLSRDLLIRALVHQLQERAVGGASRALRRRLQTLTGEFDKKSASFDPGIVPKTGTTLVRQWQVTFVKLVEKFGAAAEVHKAAAPVDLVCGSAAASRDRRHGRIVLRPQCCSQACAFVAPLRGRGLDSSAAAERLASMPSTAQWIA